MELIMTKQKNDWVATCKNLYAERRFYIDEGIITGSKPKYLQEDAVNEPFINRTCQLVNDLLPLVFYSILPGDFEYF